MPALRSFVSVVAAAMLAAVLAVAAPAGPAAASPLEDVWSIDDGIVAVGNYQQTNGTAGGNGGTLAVSLSGAPSQQSSATASAAATVAAQTSNTEAPGEWAMGSRNLARTGNAAWEEFISVPLRTDWTAAAGDKVQVNPAVVDDIAYFGGAGQDRTVYAVDLQDGDQVEWSITIDGSVLSAPAVTEDWVYFGGIDGRLYRVAAGRAADGGGQRAGTFPLAIDGPVGAIIGGPAVADGIVYFGAADSNVYAVDADTLEPVWAQPGATPERISSSVTVADGVVYATSGANEWITAFDAQTGAQLWQRHLYTWADPDTIGSAPSYSGSKLFLTGLDEKLYILDTLNNGANVVAPVALAGRAQTTPVLAAQRVFVGTNNGRVQAFDRGGVLQWNQAMPGGGIMREPIFASGLLFASSTSGTLHVLGANTGAQQWSFVAGPMFAAPSVVTNHVLVGSDDGNLYGLEPGLPTNQTHTGQPFGHYGPGQHPWQHYESDPISTTTGNLLEQRMDIAATAGRGVPVAFSRTYNSLSASTDGPLGHGWTHNLNTKLAPGTNPTITWGDGRSDLFTGLGAGTYTSPPDVHDTLTSDAAGYTLATADDITFRFTTAGALTSITDRSGNTTTLGYSGGRLTSITDASNRTITFAYNAAGRIKSATDPINQTWLYRYTGADLTEVENPAGETWTYTYDVSHRITSLTDPDSEPMYTNTYVGSTGKVATQTDGENKTWTFTYNTGNTRVVDPTGIGYTVHYDANYRTTRVVDDAGNETRSIYDAASNLVAVVDPSGLEGRFAYNDDGTIRASLDATDHKTAYTYDTDGRLVSVTDLKGNTTSYTYDPSGRPATITAPTGETTTTTYRTDGLIDTVTDSLGATTSYGYTPNGLLSSVTDPLNRTTNIALRSDGLPTSITNPANQTVTYTYDQANRVSAVTDPNLHATGFGYDGRGMRTSVTDPRTNTTSYTYDARGLLTAVTDPLNRTTSYSYDGARRLTSRTDPRNVTITRSYDTLGRLQRIDLPDQVDTTVTYDADGRTATITDGTGTTTYTYDDYGRLASEHRDLENATLSYRYDTLGRRSTLELHRGPILSARNHHSYDASGRITQLIGSTGNETDFTYDPVGRLATISHANDSVTSYTYDPAGQITRVLNLPEGLLDLQGDADTPLQATLDTLASLTNLANQLTEPDNISALSAVVTETQELIANLAGGGITVDAAIQLLNDLADTTEALDTAVGELLDPDTLTALETLITDLGDNIASLPNSAAADQATDLAEDLADLADHLSATVTDLSREIDLLGDLLVDTLRLAHAIANGQNGDPELDDAIATLAALIERPLEGTKLIDTQVEALGPVLADLTSAGGALQSAWDYTHDPAGRTTQTLRRLVTTNNEQLQFSNSYGYDPAGQLTAATTTDPAVLAGGNVNYAYDPAGNRTQVAVAGAAPIHYTYDAANQLTGDTVHTYSHDAAGNLTSRTAAGQPDLTTTYSYDSLNRLTQVQDPAGTIIDHAYDTTGRRTTTTTTDLAGKTTSDTYLYDGWDLLTTISDLGDTAYTTVGGRVLAANNTLGDIHYHPDATGNIGETTDENSNTLIRNAYTPYGETTPIASTADPDNAATQYGYSGAWGVRNSTNALLDMRNRTYDPTLGQFLSRDPLEATTGDAYNYAANNPIDLTDPTGQAPGISITISISITFVPQPAPTYNPPAGCRNAYGLCDAINTSPPGANVRCSATFGCRYYLNGQETGCLGADCGYHPDAAVPGAGGAGGGQSPLCSAARFLGYGDAFRGVNDIFNGEYGSAAQNLVGVSFVELNGGFYSFAEKQVKGPAKKIFGYAAKTLGLPVAVGATIVDPLAC